MQRDSYYLVDLVFCFDNSLSSRILLREFQELSKQFTEDFCSRMMETDRLPKTTRVRALSVGKENDNTIFTETPFFHLPKGWQAMDKFLDEIRLKSFSTALEPIDELWLIAKAILSNWNTDTTVLKKRQIIYYFKGYSSNQEPSEHFDSFLDILTDLWYKDLVMDNSGKRMIIIAPDSVPFSKISNEWEDVIHYPIQEHFSLNEDFYNLIINSSVRSV